MFWWLPGIMMPLTIANVHINKGRLHAAAVGVPHIVKLNGARNSQYQILYIYPKLA